MRVIIADPFGHRSTDRDAIRQLAPQLEITFTDQTSNSHSDPNVLIIVGSYQALPINHPESGFHHSMRQPALARLYQTLSRPTLVLDMGVSPQADSEAIAHFAMAGHFYMRDVLKVKSPRVGLLSNGEEEGKGSQLIQDTSPLLRQLPLNYVGNVEPDDIHQDAVDVAVCSGFLGRIVSETLDAASDYLLDTLQEALSQTWMDRIGSRLSAPAFERVRGSLQHVPFQGGILLGASFPVLYTAPNHLEAAVSHAQTICQSTYQQSFNAYF